MKVCLLNDSFPPVIDGVVNVMMNYADHLIADHGCEIIIGTPEYPGTDYSTYPYPVAAYPSLNTAAVTNGYRTGIPMAFKAVEQMKDFGPDIIHSHCPASATIIARVLREQCEAPVVFTYHTKYDIDITRAFKLRPLIEEGINTMVTNIEACDDIWVVSKGAGESLKKLGMTRDYIVMNNGVDFAKGKVSDELVRETTEGYDLPEGVPVFLYVGRLIGYKGLPMLLDALALMKDAYDFRMVFVGKGPDEDLLKKKAERLGLSDKCIFTGPIYNRDHLRAWDTRADLFLFPSSFDTNGLVVREAAACGLASVLIKDSCAAEGIIDGHNGFLIEENEESLAEFLRQHGQDLPMLHEAGMNAMNEIYMSWDECVDTAYKRYQTVLDMKKSGTLPEHKTSAADFLFAITNRTLEESERLRRFRKALFDDFRATAHGMMENIMEEDHIWTKFRDEKLPEITDMMEEFRKEAMKKYGDTI